MARVYLLLAYLLAACGGADDTELTSASVQRIACQTTLDCAARGGTCVANECRADNECVSSADCSGGQTCTPDADFGGLCTSQGGPVKPLPAWTCVYGKDCPAMQGCGSDGFCHADGECQNSWQPDGTLAGDCANGLLCANSGPNLGGFCTSGRGGPDPYCRSTGTGECRSLCTSDINCGFNGKCMSGFCYRHNECQTTADCSPNHLCDNPPNWDDYGFGLCLEDPNPTCVPDGQGACRLACETDLDCLHGGGCSADGLCHGSNECKSNTDCAGGQICHPDPEWGGLCGPPRP